MGTTLSRAARCAGSGSTQKVQGKNKTIFYKIDGCMIIQCIKKSFYILSQIVYRKTFSLTFINQASQLLAQQWQDKLMEKRRVENLNNHRRYLKIQEKLQNQQKDLEQYLHERDSRIQKYLDDLSFKKVTDLKSNIS